MSTYELRQLLSNLVEAWPEHDDNPTVEQAREYLESGEQPVVDDELAPDQNENYHDALWYSL